MAIETLDQCPLCKAAMDPATQDPEQPFCDICCGFLLAELRQKRVVVVDDLIRDGAGGVSNNRAPPNTVDGLSDLERRVMYPRRRSECLSDGEMNPGIGGRRL